MLEYFKNGYTLYLNSGLSSSRNHYGQRVITREADLVTAHEFGHNWGSEHDPDITVVHSLLIKQLKKRNYFISFHTGIILQFYYFNLFVTAKPARKRSFSTILLLFSKLFLKSKIMILSYLQYFVGTTKIVSSNERVKKIKFVNRNAVQVLVKEARI